MTLADKLKNRRKELRLTQGDVAKKVGVAIQTIYKYENGIVTNIPLDRLELIAKALQISPAYLMGWPEDSESYKKEDAITDIFKRLKDNPVFLTAVQKLYVLSDKQLEGVIAMLSTFEQD